MERLGKISVGGIKLSPELAQFDVKWGSATATLGPLLHGLAEEKINLAYLSISADQVPARASFCVAKADAHRVKKQIDRETALRENTTINAPIGALTVFPHKSSLTLLGHLVTTLITADCPVYGIASSISALTLTTDYNLVDHALKALESILDLPPHHMPYRQEFQVKQV